MSTKEKLQILAAIAAKPEPAANERLLVAAAVAENLYARFFYHRTTSVVWVEQALQEIEHGRQDEEAIWLRLQYLLRVLTASPDALSASLIRIRKCLNGRMLYDVVHALLNQSPEVAWKLRGFVFDYINQPTHIIASELGSYLVRAAKAQAVDAADLCQLVGAIVAFQPDSKEAEKGELRNTDQESFLARLQPVPKFDSWEYEQILEKGIRPLADKFAIPLALTLVEAVKTFEQLKEPASETRHGIRLDGSEVWCAQIDQGSGMNPDPDESLIHTLCFTCEKAYTGEGRRTTALEKLDEALRKGQWRVLERLRYHLYGKFPVIAEGWITEAVIGHAGYSDEPYGREFATMVRQATATFGESILPAAERARIFAEIKSGPLKESFDSSWRSEAQGEAYAAYQKRFWARQFWPFESILFGEYRACFEAAVASTDPIGENSYTGFSSSGFHTVESRSPKTVEELAALSDDELVAYLNNWNAEGRDEKEYWIETNFEGLANAFRQLVRQTPARFAALSVFWEKVSRPIFLRFAIDAAKDEVKAGQLEHLGPWLALCRYIAAHENNRGVEREKLDERSASAPNWESARRDVVDFVSVCFAEGSKVTGEWREPLAALLATLSTGYDMWLESGKPLITPADPLTDAINTTRGRALETLVQLGIWTRRLGGGQEQDPLRDVKPVLEMRFAGKPKLVSAEYAQMGRLYPFLLNLDLDWSAKKSEQVFAVSGSEAWQSAFGTLVMFAEPSHELHRLLRAHYGYAVDHTAIWSEEGRTRRDFLPRLGQHFFLYFAWGLESLDGADSLFARFYQATKPEVWASLLQYVGQSLKQTPTLEPALHERCIRFFESRLVVKNGTELARYAFWLEADCLDVKWRLRNLVAALDVPDQPERVSMMVIGSLVKLLPKESELVVAAFAKLIGRGVSGHAFYLDQAEVSTILKAGFASADVKTREAALSAQENLLQAGRFEYLNLGG